MAFSVVYEVIRVAQLSVAWLVRLRPVRNLSLAAGTGPLPALYCFFPAISLLLSRSSLSCQFSKGRLNCERKYFQVPEI